MEKDDTKETCMHEKRCIYEKRPIQRPISMHIDLWKYIYRYVYMWKHWLAQRSRGMEEVYTEGKLIYMERDVHMKRDP